jgi:hypothetical protein
MEPEPTDSWFHETTKTAEMLLRETREVMDMEAIVSRWYARSDSDGYWCVMDADRSPTEDHPPVLDGLTRRMAQHIAAAHNHWIDTGGPVSTRAALRGDGQHPVSQRIKCPACEREYMTTPNGLIRVHYLGGYNGGKRCVCSGMTMEQARVYAEVKKQKEAADAA